MQSVLRLGGVVAIVLGVVACKDSTGTSGNNGNCTPTAVTLNELQGTIVASSGGVVCLSVPENGGTYIVMPEFATDQAAARPVAFTMTTTSSAAAGAGAVVHYELMGAPTLRGARGTPPMAAQLAMDAMMRRRAADAARLATPSDRALAAGLSLQAAVQAGGAPPATRTFQVLANLNGTSFKTDTANLKFNGNNIIIYQSKFAPAPPNGFTDAQIVALGNTFDQDLYGIDVATFGSPTDIDANGHVIVLLTPFVNALTPSAQCTTSGFVAGFFYPLDLLPSQAHSNDAEMFYAAVPDEQGTFSCVHHVSSIGLITLSTFIHEFQHMISFGQHVLIRGGSDEDNYLNEGQSHLAEELGSRFYENKFPPPTGRTDPTQLFPDSAQGFINGDLFNGFNYLSNTTALSGDSASVSDWGGDGTLVQRGAIWLFLRWLGDLEDSTVYGRLDQTNLTGSANITNAAGTPFETLLGQFAVALYTGDSLPGVAVSALPPEFRFSSRNFRFIYDTEHGRNPATFTTGYPIVGKVLAVPGTATNTMYPGTMDFYKVTTGTGGGTTTVKFAGTGGAGFSTVLNPQASVFRCPASPANACP